MRRLGESAWKQALFRLQFRLLDPRCDCGSRRFGQFKLDRPLRFSLNDHCSGQDLVTVHDVSDAEVYEVATPQFAVDRQVEHCQVSDLMGVLKMNSDSPDVFWLKRRFLANQLTLVP